MPGISKVTVSTGDQ